MAKQIKYVPHCRKCGVSSKEVPEFIARAAEHNASNNPLQIAPQTMAFGPGNHYDPSTNSFICPECKEDL